MGSKIFLGKYRVSAEEIEAVGEPGDNPLSYEGEEIESGTKVVVKVIPAASLNSAMREQLEANAMAAKKLAHVNIHALHDFGIEDAHLIYITENFGGTLVEDWVNTNGPMPVGPVLRIASQVVSALGAAEFQRIVHRAINPSNILLVPGQTADGEWPLVKVLHFVGATRKSSGAGRTATGFDKSLPYESPEQLQHGIVDFRSEVYSLGATMWFLLTGVPPRMTPEGPMAAPPKKAGLSSDKISAVPENIRRLLAKMLSVDPNARPRDPLAFYLQLQECMAEMGPRESKSRPPEVQVASPTGPIGLPTRPRLSRKAVALAALFLLIAAVMALVWPGYLRSRVLPAKAPIRGPTVRGPGAVVSVPTAPKATPASTLAPVRSEPPQQSAEPAVRVTLVSFTPMAGTPGGRDFKIATLTFKIEASNPVALTEASFYVDSAAFDEGPVNNAPITLFIHTGIFLGPPGTTVDPVHPIQRTVWLKSQENLYPNWSRKYNQTENATFRWTIAGQPGGGSVVKPLHQAWPNPSPTPEVRRAETAQPEKKRAERPSPTERPR